KLASSPSRGTIMPTQFGPTMRIRCGFAAPRVARCKLPPCSPSSPKPAVITTAARVPRFAGPMDVNDAYPIVDEHVQYHLGGAWPRKPQYIASHALNGNPPGTS